MALRTQAVDGRLTENGIRHLRQYVATGHQVSRDDVLALISQHFELVAEVARLQGVLAPFERDHLADKAGAWTEGWIAGTDAMMRGFTPEERLLTLAEAAGYEENPYAAQLDAPVVEDLPEPIGGAH